ncbi:MAG: PKD domain-containing protein [Bacteroidales bacterium]
MKKLLILLILCFSGTFLMAQNNVLILWGSVTDSATGTPVPNYPVHIDIDSTSGGFFYHQDVLTMQNGFYTDTIFFDIYPIPTGTLRISIWDCRQVLHSVNFNFGPGNQNFTQNFIICVGSPINCHADFYPSTPPPPPNPLAVHFINISTGGNGPWNWQFGDGTGSNQFSPVHLFPAAGMYQVTLTMGDSASGGCFSDTTHEVNVGDSMGEGCHAEFAWYCDSMMMTTVNFINQSSGDSASWNWSFGDSTFSTDKNPVHTYAHNGRYHVCLTMTKNNPPCTDTKCHDINAGPPPPEGCENWFHYMADWLHVSFEGFMHNNPPATYTWLFGDGTGGNGRNVDHFYVTPGVYSVSLTTIRQDSSNCAFTSTQQVMAGDSTIIHQVYGQVIAGSFPLNHGLAMIFSNDTITGGMPYFSMSLIDSTGIYMFPYVPNGDYVIWALPFDSLGGFLPTFYQHSLFWEQANVIQLGQPANPYNINLIHAGSMSNGQGGINGHINTTGLKITTVQEITMLLTDELGNAIGFRRVNSSGTFNFSDMAYGTYYLKPELPNTTSDQVKVVLSASNQTANVIITFNGSSISGISENSYVESITVYPVPVNNMLNVNVKLVMGAKVSAELYSFTGQKVFGENYSLTKGDNMITIDMDLLGSCLYTLRLTSPDGINIVKKIVKL